MSTIPSTFNQHIINYTTLEGNAQLKSTMNVTCIVFNRASSPFRQKTFESLISRGFEKIISVEQNTGSFNTEALSRQFPQVTFLIAQDSVSTGDMINLAVNETKSPYMLIVPQELACGRMVFTSQMAKKYMEKDQFCIVPHLYSSSMQALPVNFTPVTERSVFKIESSISSSDSEPTLYAADYAGFYNREKFIQTGGFDYTIRSSYWQKIDLYMRAWLWGERVTVSSGFEMSYSDIVPDDDMTTDLSSLRFYLKNLAPVYKIDHGYIPSLSFISFNRRSSCGLRESLRQFSGARKWTQKNQYRFKTDAAHLIQEWGA